MVFKWLLERHQQDGAASDAPESSGGTGVAGDENDVTGPVSAKQIDLELLRNREQIHLEVVRAAIRRDDEAEKTTQFIRRVRALAMYGAPAVILTVGSILLVLHSLEGLDIPGSPTAQAAASTAGTALLTCLSIWGTGRIRDAIARRSGATDATRPRGQGGQVGDERAPADAP